MNVVEDSSIYQRHSTNLNRLSNELYVLSIDHCYAKPWSSHPEASNAKPLHMLFMDPFPHSGNPEKHRTSDVINVEDITDEMCHPYDTSKFSMLENEKWTSLLPPDYLDNKDDWEDHIATLRSSCTVQQNKNFAKVMRILQADRLARLSIIRTKNEQIQRRLQIDKAAKRVRIAFANVAWDMSLILWLHNFFLENLRGQLLISYIEVLQALKVKIPTLVDRLISGTHPNLAGFSIESLTGILKRNWDPALAVINQHKLKRLPENPLLLLIPNVASTSSPNLMLLKRHKFWHSQLNAVGKVISLASYGSTLNLSISACLEKMITNARAKILELKNQFPGRPVVLVGWQVGALIAIHIASMETVQGVICLGFPTIGINGNRGEIDDSIYNCRTPTLFVVGQHASSCSLDMLEDIRERLRMETRLVLVGGADDQLRMSRAKKQSCSVTQAVVDRCIMDEMYQFMCSILSQTHLHTDLPDDIDVCKKQRKRKQKDITNAIGSQTVGVKTKQLNAIKSVKLSKTVGYSGQFALSGKIVQRSPKKKINYAGDSTNSTSKLMQTPISSLSSDSVATLSKVSEAEAIASAPELSSLLQNIKKPDQSKPDNISSALETKLSVQQTATTMPTATTSTTMPSTMPTTMPSTMPTTMPSTMPTTTALTLSKFLQSSGLLRAGSVLKSSAPQAKDAEKNQTPGSNYPKQPEIHMKQPQILIRSGTTAPFSIPLTFSMANKVLKATPMMKITPSSAHIHPSSAQIHQLLSSFTGTSPSVLVSSAPATQSMVNTAPSCTPLTPAEGRRTPVTSDSASPCVTSMPCTVSIDLGQVTQASRISSSGMKFVSPAPKISLISNLKPVTSTVSAGKTELLVSQSSHASSSATNQTSSTPSTRSVHLSPSSGLMTYSAASDSDDESDETWSSQNVKQTCDNHSGCQQMNVTINSLPSIEIKVDPSQDMSSSSAQLMDSSDVQVSTPDMARSASRSSGSMSVPGHIRASKSTITSYTATPKSVLSTSASTRTRKIKTPKQYDL